MYLVIELQKQGESLANICTAFNDQSLAEQKYHQILSSASVSTVDVHSAVLMLYDGYVLKKETYYHNGAEE